MIFQAVEISEASPAWQDYVDYVDSIVLDGLKRACTSSLKAMLRQIVEANDSEVSAGCNVSLQLCDILEKCNDFMMYSCVYVRGTTG